MTRQSKAAQAVLDLGAALVRISEAYQNVATTVVNEIVAENDVDADDEYKWRELVLQRLSLLGADVTSLRASTARHLSDDGIRPHWEYGGPAEPQGPEKWKGWANAPGSTDVELKQARMAVAILCKLTDVESVEARLEGQLTDDERAFLSELAGETARVVEQPRLTESSAVDEIMDAHTVTSAAPFMSDGSLAPPPPPPRGAVDGALPPPPSPADARHTKATFEDSPDEASERMHLADELDDPPYPDDVLCGPPPGPQHLTPADAGDGTRARAERGEVPVNDEHPF